MNIFDLFAAAAANHEPEGDDNDNPPNAGGADAAANAAAESGEAGKGGEAGDGKAAEADKGDGKEPAKATDQELEAVSLDAMSKAMLEEAPGAKKSKTAALEGKAKPEQAGEKPAKTDGEPGEKGKSGEKDKAPAAPDKDKPADKVAAKPGEPDPEVEKEIVDLKLGERASARFREMSDGLRNKDISLDAVSKLFGADGKTAEELIPQIRSVLEDANLGRQWTAGIEQSGMTPEEFGSVMAVAAARNSGDPTGMRRAFDEISRWRDELASELGIATDTVDPLITHEKLLTADERARLATGDLGQGDARAILELRAAAAKRDEQSQRVRTNNDQRQAQSSAINDATAQVLDYTAALRATDPQTFDRTFEFVKPKIARIQANNPPDKWHGLIKAEFDEALPIFKKHTPPPEVDVTKIPERVGRVPGRATGAAGVRQPDAMAQDEKDPFAAMKSAMGSAWSSEKQGARTPVESD